MSFVKTLVNSVAVDPAFGRYSDPECINICPTTGERSGAFSVAIKATDGLNGDCKVVLKFLDPQVRDLYRIHGFKNESLFLKRLNNARRCCHLVEEYSDYSIVADAMGSTLEIPCPFYVTKFYPLSIEDTFLSDSVDVVDKLVLFRSIILAVKAIHDRGVCHRDLKADNFRGEDQSGEIVSYVIDFGTASCLDIKRFSDPLSGYSGPTGHTWYSPPESYCGLAGCRDILDATDSFALGAMLYELFNNNSFNEVYYAESSTKISDKIDTIIASMSGCKSEADKLEKWKDLSGRIFKDIKYPQLISKSTKGLDSVAQEVEKIFQQLIHFDFQKRERNMLGVLNRIDICLKILKNKGLIEFERERKRKWKQNRLAKKELVALNWNGVNDV
jgi:serine/threonine protein kinase